MAKFVKCCEHNECPDRPKHFLGRFATRPWRCPQCGQYWTTHTFMGYWQWQKVKGPGER